MGCGGHGYLWKAYRAKRKKDGFECSVFVFEKAILEKKLKGRAGMVKQVTEVMRREVRCLAEFAGVDPVQLQKAQAAGLQSPATSLKDKVLAAASEKMGASSVVIASATRRCPVGILQLMETFETRSAIVFVGERVNGTLGNAVRSEGEYSNSDEDWRSTAAFSTTEIARGTASICDALTAIQSGVGAGPRRIHLSVAPESVWIAKTGDWRLAGLGFAMVCEEAGVRLPPFFSHETNEELGRPRIAYVAPEILVQNQSVDGKADVFSLFLIVYELLSKQQLFQDCSDSVRSYLSSAKLKLQFLNLEFAPALLRDALQRALRVDSLTRPESSAVRNAPGFHTAAVRLLTELDVAAHRDPPTAAAFLTQLATFVTESGDGCEDDDTEGASAFETNRSLRIAVIPTLQLAAKAHHGALAAHAALVAISCGQRLNVNDFRNLLQTVFDAILEVQTNDAALRVFVDAAELVLEKADAKWAADVVTAAFVRALGPVAPKAKKNARDALYDVALRRLAESTTLDALLAKSSLANPKLKSAVAENLVPAIGRIAIEEAHALPLRVLALKALASALERPTATPTDTLQRVVAPALSKATRTVGGQPALAMCVLGCFDLLAQRMPDNIARHVLPALMPMLDEKALNLKQFDMVVARVQAMLSKVVEQRRKELGGTRQAAVKQSQDDSFYADNDGDLWANQDISKVQVPKLKPITLDVPDSVGGDTDPFALGPSLNTFSSATNGTNNQAYYGGGGGGGPPSSSASGGGPGGYGGPASSSSLGSGGYGGGPSNSSYGPSNSGGYGGPSNSGGYGGASALDARSSSSNGSPSSRADPFALGGGASSPNKQVGVHRKAGSQPKARGPKAAPKLRVAPPPAAAPPAAPAASFGGAYDPFAATPPPALSSGDPFGGLSSTPPMQSASMQGALGNMQAAGMQGSNFPDDPFAAPSSFGFMTAPPPGDGAAFSNDPFAGMGSSFPPPPMQQQQQPPSQFGNGSGFDFMNN